MENKFAVGILVANKFGVLSRIAGLYSKRGFNIDSIAAGKTENPDYTRITIVSEGDEYVEEQVVKQLGKLHDVIGVYLYKNDDAISAEHLLIKFGADTASIPKIKELINLFGGVVLEFGDDYLTAGVWGQSEKLDAFIGMAIKFGILEICRSGPISLSHGKENILKV